MVLNPCASIFIALLLLPRHGNPKYINFEDELKVTDVKEGNARDTQVSQMSTYDSINSRKDNMNNIDGENYQYAEEYDSFKSVENKEEISDPTKDHISHGDIMFRPGEEESLFGTGERNNSTSSDVTVDRLWTMPIPYGIRSTVGTRVRNFISQTIQEYREKTCVRFRVKMSSDTDYIWFNNNPRCWSFVGNRGGRHEVNLGRSCAYKTRVIHEITHALGFYHEQTRLDRDSYVTILYNNIKPELWYKFNKIGAWLTTTTYGYPYDYDSVMHYHKKSFSKNGKNTIEAVNDTGRMLGQPHNGGLSLIDALQMNARYCNTPQSSVNINTLNEEIRRYMLLYSSQSNDDLRYTILYFLKKRYPHHFFTVSIYNAVYGYDQHAFFGNCAYAFRYHGKNAVVCYAKRNSDFLSYSRETEIKDAVLDTIRKVCDAKEARDKAWDTARRYHYLITAVHVVRHGNGLRSIWTGRHTYFENFKCGSSGWWSSKRDEKSSLVLMFGSPH